MSQTPPAARSQSPARTPAARPLPLAAPPGRPAALGRLILGAVASLAAAAAGTLAPVAPDAYAAEAVSRASLPTPVAAVEPGDRLTVTVRDAGGGADGTFELRCHPQGGSHPDAREACGRLDRRTTWGTDPFAPVGSGTVCTMQYGGPATAHVTGTWAGRRVDARFDRGNGCEIARWDKLVPVLPDVRA
ncbi:SSI family serine proteinase inhibitor [Streptomyces europaeiscabiei]|uniref:SSI family serine proteinase inhibitor n=1 Tax=Streptomyces europaeiscabiei TaxID=146819 RepID=UPI0029A80ED5|nr:SSI family serine proteinase inhibitor [Streptomyces europaeiscabiei]MDX3690540.1 SSI family serine proteinase inhibitor [Streptomyces europaeiscabiei]